MTVPARSAVDAIKQALTSRVPGRSALGLPPNTRAEGMMNTIIFSVSPEVPREFSDRIAGQEVRSRSIRYQFIFRKVADGSEVARGQVAAVCATVDKTTGKLAPVLIPETIRARITPAPPDHLPSSP